MKKLICENLEELNELKAGVPSWPEDDERVPPEIRDVMYQAGKENFEKEGVEKNENEFGVEEELMDYFLELITDTKNYTDLDRASIERIFKKAMDITYQEG